MKVVVLTTSYPRSAEDVAGTFVRDGVEALRANGLEVRIVSPADFRHYGIAYGDGIVANLRQAPWKVLALPLFLVEFARAARRVARGADVVHAHWLPSALPALATGKPFVLQLWGPTSRSPGGSVRSRVSSFAAPASSSVRRRRSRTTPAVWARETCA